MDILSKNGISYMYLLFCDLPFGVRSSPVGLERASWALRVPGLQRGAEGPSVVGVRGGGQRASERALQAAAPSRRAASLLLGAPCSGGGTSRTREHLLIVAFVRPRSPRPPSPLAPCRLLRPSSAPARSCRHPGRGITYARRCAQVLIH